MKALSLLIAPLLLTACSAPPGDPTLEPNGTAAEAIGYGTDDVGTTSIDELQRNAVVRLQGSTALCSGTLISPRVVLTARHCAYGTTDDPGGTGANTTVGVGHNMSLASANAAKTLYYVGYGGAAPESPSPDDHDIALLIINPASANQPIGNAIITRPSFVPPAPSDHLLAFDEYTNPVVQAAGWSPLSGSTTNTRQVTYAPFLKRSSQALGTTLAFDGVWNAYWQDGAHGIQHGDSGGPLFVTRADGTRDVIGVTSSRGDTVNSVSNHVDITAINPHAWILANVQDTTRSAAWLNRHGRTRGDYWIGEADYTGPCSLKQGPDADCDHWYDAHDNCPTVANTDQQDANDDGIGDACPLPGAPRCTTVAACEGLVQVRCDAAPGTFTLERTDGSAVAVASMTSNGSAQEVLYDHAPATAKTEIYRVCDANSTGWTCTTLPSVTVNHAACTVMRLP